MQSKVRLTVSTVESEQWLTVLYSGVCTKEDGIVESDLWLTVGTVKSELILTVVTVESELWLTVGTVYTELNLTVGIV